MAFQFDDEQGSPQFSDGSAPGMGDYGNTGRHKRSPMGQLAVGVGQYVAPSLLGSMIMPTTAPNSFVGAPPPAGGGAGNALSQVAKWGSMGKMPTMIGAVQGGVGAFMQAREQNAQRKLQQEQLNKEFDYRKAQDTFARQDAQAKAAYQADQTGNPFMQAGNRARAALVEQLLTNYKSPTLGDHGWEGGLSGIGANVYQTLQPFFSDTARAGAEQQFQGLVGQMAPQAPKMNLQAAGYSPDALSRLAQLLGK